MNKTLKVRLTLNKHSELGTRHFNLTFENDLTDEQLFEMAVRHASTRWGNSARLADTFPADDNANITINMSDVYFEGRQKGPRDPIKTFKNLAQKMNQAQKDALIEQLKASGFLK